MPLALAYCKTGNHQSAVQHADAAVRHFREIGSTGINLGLAYETRARIVIAMKDTENYKKNHALCAEQLIGKDNCALAEKVDKLVREAEHSELELSDETGSVDNTDQSIASRLLTDTLMSFRKTAERVERLLFIFIEQSAAAGGAIYTMQKDGPVLSAKSNQIELPHDIESRIRSYISNEVNDTTDATATSTEVSSNTRLSAAGTGLGIEEYSPVLLGHYTEEGYAITGLVVLMPDPKKTFRAPVDIIPIVSQILLDAGDVATFVVTYYGTR